MRRLSDVVQARTTAGAPVTVGGVTVTPQAWVIIVRLPRGFLVWNQPTGVLIERAGRVERRPIIDVTLTVQAALWALALAATLTRAFIHTLRQETTHDRQDNQ